ALHSLVIALAAAFAGTAAQAHGGHEPPAGARQDVGTSPWGPADEIGRLNLITPASRAAILQRITGGQVYDLATEYYVG
ncbi:cyclase family protein, partial [Klebsiella pneumoniae]|nr:cyclase family protein [Klebsiella pneumoniae]